ncbi:hypothetical protein QFC24_002171 [Naganishia onofrii]|uniref:Uncharacterized protein n=1 Tax=Naganishia onofrii TaxID=1851511 RepID=A0ACC2XQY7_9TREE|nr:hypothetical protein QFC24_002171 [Naganishia onofrii]
MEEDKKKKGKEKDGSEDDDDLHSGLDSFKTVQHYAEDTKTCRHVAICRYFGEKIDETDSSIAGLYCQKMCDICAHPEKVALRATHLTEDVVVASQVPKRKECNLDSFAPVNSVNFYNLDVRQALAAESSHRPSAPTILQRTGVAIPPPPKVPPRIQPIPQVNPYAAAVSASMSTARRPFGLSTNPNRSVPTPERQPNTVIVEDLPSKPTKKMKTVEASPYAASPSVAANRNTFNLKPFKTPFASTQTPAAPSGGTQRVRNRLTQSTSLDTSYDEGDIQVLAQCSQKIGISLRNAGLKSVVRALGRALTADTWLRLLGHDVDERMKAQDRNKAILVAAKDSEYDILCMSVTPEGFNARIEELVSAIENTSAWNALLTRRDSSDDTEDDEVLGLRALEKNILAYCSKAAKRVSGHS